MTRKTLLTVEDQPLILMTSKTLLTVEDKPLSHAHDQENTVVGGALFSETPIVPRRKVPARCMNRYEPGGLSRTFELLQEDYVFLLVLVLVLALLVLLLLLLLLLLLFLTLYDYARIS